VTLPQDFGFHQALLFRNLLMHLEDAPLVLPEVFQRRRSNSLTQLVLVDDLDRCGAEFVADTLKAMREWRDVPNLFFIVAANEDHLLEAMRFGDSLHLPEDRERALQKYVHVTANLPPMVQGPQEMLEYFVRLARHIETGDDSETLAQLLSRTARSIEDQGTDSLLAPLFDSTGLTTPRELKHRLNRLLTEFRSTSDPPDDALVRRWIMKAFWPDIWWKNVWEVEVTRTAADPSPRGLDSRRWLRDLCGIAHDLRPLWSMGPDELRPPISHLLHRRGWPDREIDPSFVLYLAQSGWEPPDPTPTRVNETSGKRPEPNIFETQKPAETGAIAAGDESGLDDALSEDPQTPYARLYLMYLQASQFENDGNREQAASHLQQLIRFAEAAPRLEPRSAITVGNAALIAERMGIVSLATDMHRLAYNLQPTHLNIRQNLVEHVVDDSVEAEYDLAIAIARGLLSEPEAADKPLRSAILAWQLAQLTGDTTLAPTDMQERVRSTIEREEGLNSVQLGRLGRYIDQHDDPHYAEEMYRHAARSNDGEARATALRRLAGYWAGRPEHSYEQRALDLFRFILTTGHGCLDSRPSTWLLNSVAQLLKYCGYLEESLYLFDYIVRSVGPTDYTRTSFAQALHDRDLDDVAVAVMLGHEYTYSFPAPDQPLPPSFSDPGTHWWLEFPAVGSACDVPSFLLLTHRGTEE
jgi:hypothetical protein